MLSQPTWQAGMLLDSLPHSLLLLVLLLLWCSCLLGRTTGCLGLRCGAPSAATQCWWWPPAQASPMESWTTCRT